MQQNIYAEISHSPINILSASEFVMNNSHGGTAFFQGTVRNRNNGRDVLAVTYDVHEQLAMNSFLGIYENMLSLWKEPLKVYISHYSGRLPVNGISILIAVSAVHRDEAFKACRYILEEIKHKSPIWKQEHYTDGDSEWVKGHALCNSSPMDY